MSNISLMLAISDQVGFSDEKPFGGQSRGSGMGVFAGVFLPISLFTDG